MRRRSRQQETSPFDVSLRERLRYRFDNVLARGTGAALFWLGAVTVAAVLVSSLLLTIFGVTLSGSENGAWLEDFWQSLLRILDTGTMAGDVGWGRRVLALLVTLFGVLIAGTLIGIIAAGVEDRIDSMRRGRSVVIESGHLVILGGSSRIPAIIEQLVLANAAHGSNTIVVLAEVDPTELRRLVVEAVSDPHQTHIVYRFGDPRVRADLALARVGEARGVIVLPHEGGDDVSVMHTVLALNAELGGLPSVPIVAEVADATTAERLVHACGPEHASHCDRPGDRTNVGVRAPPTRTEQGGQRTHRLRRLRSPPRRPPRSHGVCASTRSSVDMQTLDPSASAVVMVASTSIRRRSRPWRRVTGWCSLRTTSKASSLRPTTTRLQSGGPGGRRSARVTEPIEEHILVVGWNPLGPHLLTGWAARTSASSSVEVAFDPRHVEPDDVVVPDIGVDVQLSPTPESSSLSLDPRPTTIVVLGYTSVDVDEADARTMLDVMQLRRRCAQTGEVPRLVVQLLGEEHADLADLTGPDDFLISAALGSQLLAQLIEQPERRDVLLELYGGANASIRLIRCDRLDLVGTFTTTDIVATSYAAGVLAIGWRRLADRG